MLTELGLTHRVVTVPALDALIDRMIGAGDLGQLSLSGLGDQRTPSFPGGVAILVEVMRTLGIEEMGVTDGALREGIIYDMLGRITHEDARERTVREMASHYRVDEAQAARVAATAAGFLAQVAPDWKLANAQAASILKWAAALHEIGLDIAHARYHHHGAYLLAHADMGGFPWAEQRLLACLVQGHRRHLSEDFACTLPPKWRKAAIRLTVLLRLAVLMHRSRGTEPLPDIRLGVDGKRICLCISPDWLIENPLTRADLDRERSWLQSVNIRLAVDDSSVIAVG